MHATVHEKLTMTNFTGHPSLTLHTGFVEVGLAIERAFAVTAERPSGF